MEKIIIPNFDRNKSYPNIVQQPKTKIVPIYPNRKLCSCHYEYKCDDPSFSYDEPYMYKEIPIEL